MFSSKILVVDDQPVNIQLLQRKFEKEGIQVLAAYTGQEALDLIPKERPDVVLLDIMMPDMDGLDVLARLQKDPATRTIPVIFITARSSKENKLQGLNTGAVDYIVKPIDLDETLARVQTQLRLVAVNREMVDLQRRLQEARRSATVGAVTQGIAHNLNNLLGIVLGYLDLIKIHNTKPELVRKNAESVESAVQRIVVIIRPLSSLVIRSRPALETYHFQTLLKGAVARWKTDLKADAPIALDLPAEDIALESHLEIFEDVIAKILQNAWESYDERPVAERKITIRARTITYIGKVPALEITIEDNGHGISDEVRDNMFEPFISTKSTVGIGMGLTVARHALRNLGGEVTLTDRPGGGAIATLIHPLARPASAKREA